MSPREARLMPITSALALRKPNGSSAPGASPMGSSCVRHRGAARTGKRAARGFRSRSPCGQRRSPFGVRGGDGPTQERPPRLNGIGSFECSAGRTRLRASVGSTPRPRGRGLRPSRGTRKVPRRAVLHGNGHLVARRPPPPSFCSRGPIGSRRCPLPRRCGERSRPPGTGSLRITKGRSGLPISRLTAATLSGARGKLWASSGLVGPRRRREIRVWPS